MFLQDKTNGVMKNTKIKQYRDGSMSLTRCSHAIFRPLDWEEHISQVSMMIENIIYQQQIKEHLENNVFITYDENGNPFKFWDVSKDPRTHRPKERTDEVRPDNVKRAKDAVFDIVYENDWKYFITITFSPEEIDREEPRAIVNKLSKWLYNRVVRKGLAYILIPEYHEDGKGIHCHALINDTDLKFTDSGTRLVKGYNKPVKLSTIREKHLCDKLGCDEEDLQTVYNIGDWKYGFSTAIETYGEASAVAYYITKYVTKDTKKIFGKFYWSSKNIRRKPDIVFCNSEFDPSLPVVEIQRANRSFQYESSFSFRQTEQQKKNCEDILRILKENGLD